MTEDDGKALASKAMIQVSRDLRKRTTDTERVLWEALRNRQLDGLKFRRQHAIPNTAFVVDFYCHSLRLVIEIDGGIHRQQVGADTNRQAVIEALGYHVIRFPNNQVIDDLDAVLRTIADEE